MVCFETCPTCRVGAAAGAAGAKEKAGSWHSCRNVVHDIQFLLNCGKASCFDVS